MTNKGMSAINEALTVVENAPINFTNGPDAIVISKINALKFLVNVVKHAVDNSDKIKEVMLESPPFRDLVKVNKHLPSDFLMCAYIAYSLQNAAETLTLASKGASLMTPEKFLEFLTKELDIMMSRAEAGGICVL